MLGVQGHGAEVQSFVETETVSVRYTDLTTDFEYF